MRVLSFYYNSFAVAREWLCISKNAVLDICQRTLAFVSTYIDIRVNVR